MFLVLFLSGFCLFLVWLFLEKKVQLKSKWNLNFFFFFFISILQISKNTWFLCFASKRKSPKKARLSPAASWCIMSYAWCSRLNFCLSPEQRGFDSSPWQIPFFFFASHENELLSIFLGRIFLKARHVTQNMCTAPPEIHFLLFFLNKRELIRLIRRRDV